MRLRRSDLVAMTGLLMVFGLSAGRTRADQMVGFIHSINPETRTLVVEGDQTGNKYDVTINDQTRLMTPSGQTLKFKDLKKGDGVGITHNGGNALSVMVNQAVLRGVVERIDLDGKKIVIDEADSDRDVDVNVSDDMVIETKDGKVLTLKQLKTGDGVGISYAGSTPTKVVVNVKPTELRGHIESVGADQKSLVIKEIGTNANVSVAVTPNTSILTTSGQTIPLKDLKKGDGVGIAHDASVASKIVVNVAPAR